MNYKTLTTIGGAVAVLSICFLPVIGCGGENLNGVGLLKWDQTPGAFKFLLILVIVLGLLIFRLKEAMHLLINGAAGVITLIVGYLYAKDKMGNLDLKSGYYLSIFGFIMTGIVSYMQLKGMQIGQPGQQNNAGHINTADELLKLKKLLDEGVLNQEEYDEQKRKLLG